MADLDPGNDAPSWRPRPFEAVLLGLAAAILGYQLLLPPIVGLADNGDYGRILGPLGLEPAVPDEWGERYFLYVNREYDTVPRTGPGWLSSELTLAWTAVTLDRLFTRDDTFDLVVLSAVHLAAYLVGLYLLLLGGGTLRAPGRQVFGIGLLLASTDFAYVSTFNSFYAESASLVFLVLLAGLTLVVVRRRRPPRWLLPAFFLCAALFLSAKPQNFPLVLPLSLLPAAVLLRRQPAARPRWVLLAAGALLVFVGWLSLRMPPALERSANLWNAVFCSILPRSPAPAADLAELGLDAGLARYSGVNFWTSEPKPAEVTDGYGFTGLLLFYARHPRRLLELAGDCAREAFRWREPLLGNFTREAGRPPGARNDSFTLWSRMEDALFPKSLAFLALAFLGFLVGVAWELWRHGTGSAAGSTAALCLVLALMAALSFVVAVVGEGTTDIVKHLFIFQVLFDGCLIAGLAWLACRLAPLAASVRLSRLS